MEYSQIATATLFQLNEELAAAGWFSGHSSEQNAKEAVRKLFAKFGKAQTKTILVTWDEIDGIGRLIAHCYEDETLDETLTSSVVRWDEPITPASDSHAIANAVVRINGAEIVTVNHDGKFVFVHVFA